MSVVTQSRFVLFPIGARRFALPAESVAELARPDQLQSFPHTSQLLSGVLVRRGNIVPVCDIAQVLVGPNAPARKFYLIATRRFGRVAELTALPVTGECELASADVVAPAGKSPDYVVGLLSIGQEIVEVVDLEKLAGTEARA